MVFVFVALGVPAGIVGIPLSMLRGNTRIIYGWAMIIVRLGLRVGGVRVRVVGAENIPQGVSCIFLSNHVSNLDPPALISVLPGMTSFLLKKEILNIPLLGTAMRLGKFVPVSRSSSKEEAEASTKAAADALREGLHITIFPEGTRSTTGELLPFKKGAFYLAVASGAPLVPVIIRGTVAMLPKGSWKITPGEAVVEFLPAITSAAFATREELMASVRREMEDALNQ